MVSDLRLPGIYGKFFKLVSCIPCPSYKIMSQNLEIRSFVHIKNPLGTSLIWWSAVGRLLAVLYISLATVARPGMSNLNGGG